MNVITAHDSRTTKTMTSIDGNTGLGRPVIVGRQMPIMGTGVNAVISMHEVHVCVCFYQF